MDVKRERMPRGLKATEDGRDKALLALPKVGLNRKRLQERLQEELDLDGSSSIGKFFNCQSIDRLIFLTICQILELDSKEIADLSTGCGGGNGGSSIIDFNFIGRKSEIDDLNSLINQGAKVILIQGKGGVGKTALARHFLSKSFEIILEFPIAPTHSANITDVKILIDQALIKLGENPVSNLLGALNQLKQHLKTRRRIGILIDNLETALDNKQKFIQSHANYGELLRTLSDSTLQSITLITSRERLGESAVAFQVYLLKGLEEEDWKKFFKERNIETDTPSSKEILHKIHKAWAGNSKAMDIIMGIIRREWERDIEAYWNGNKHNLLMENTLADLVASQFNRLQELDPEAYKLLYRLGCYRYQDLSTVSKEGLLCLLWDVSDKKRCENIINSLKYCSLVEYRKEEYWLHPMIREAAIARLRGISLDEWEITNRKAGEYYIKKFDDAQTSITALFEAIKHFYDAKDYDKCYQVLIFKILEGEHLENLRCSENLWIYTNRIIKLCEQLIEIENLPAEQKALILVPLGVLYPEIGKNKQANKVSNEILRLTDNIHEKNDKIKFAKFSAYLIAARANKFIGNFSEALKVCENGSKLAQEYKRPYWKALALYELGTVHLEKARLKESRRSRSLEAAKALRCIGASAFLAIGSPIPEEIYKFIITPIEEVPARLKSILKKHGAYQSKDDYTKKFRILHNIGRCLNSMNLYKLARIMLQEALKFLPDTDHTNKTWSYLELASCYSGMRKNSEAQEYYDKASLRSESAETICEAFTLIEYGNWQDNQGANEDALKKYQKLEEILRETEFEFLKARNYYSLCIAYLQFYPEKIEEIERYLTQTKTLCEELNLPLITKVVELKEKLAE